MKNYIMKQKGLLTVSILFSILFSVGSTLIALVLKEVIDAAVSKNLNHFIFLIKQSSVYFVLLGICYWLYSKYSKKFICMETKLLRNAVFSGILKRNISDFKSVNSADYLSALTNDVKNIEDNYFHPLLLCLQNIILFIASFIIMLYLSPLALICLFAVLFLLIIIPGLFQAGIQKRQDNYSKEQSNLTMGIKDFLSGFEVIRSYQINDHVKSSFHEKNNNVYFSKYELDCLISTVEALSAVLGIAVQCSVLFVAAYLIITGKISAGALVGLVQVSATIVAPIQTLSQSIPQIQGCKPIIERLNNLANYQDSSFTGNLSPSFDKEISVQDLQFGYEQEKVILKGIHYSFKKGKKYAVVGASGCGKTTLINLLSGYYADYKGIISYDETDIRDLDIQKLNKMSSVIHQNVYMFDESIKDNICLHKNVDPAALTEVLDISGVSTFLDNNRTLESFVGENGNNLSGGQRQRVAVARALMQKKPLLILDEGTSAIDMQTAYDIESKLLNIKELTVITITHSLNPELLAHYDEIIYMQAGTIIESGTYSELLNCNGVFADFIHLKNN